MDPNLSFIVPHYDQARRLGNPKDPVYFYPELQLTDTTYHGLSSVRDRIGPYTFDIHYGCSVIGYQIDSSKFDTGHIFVLRFRRNDSESPCLENDILNDPEAFLGFVDFHEEGLPDVLRYHLSGYITAIDFRTEKGERIFEPVYSLSIDDLPFNTVPEALNAIPRVMISELTAPQEFFTPFQDLVVVSYNGNLYVFRNHTIFPMPEESITWDDEHLQEVIHLSRFQSNSIMPPSFIVTGTGKSAPKFRGYLHPYCPAGSLEDVLLRVNKAKRQTRDNRMEPSTPKASVTNSLTITWPVKLQWTIDITTGLVALHKAEAYIGVLCLQNLLLNLDGHIKLIDISPVLGFNLSSAAPEVDNGLNIALTGPRDIFSLGLIFWQLAEELVYSDRETTRQIPRPSWHNERNSAPQWFRVLVQNCLSNNPALRPSADIVLSTLLSQDRTST